MTTKKTAMVISSVSRYRRRAWMASQTLDAARRNLKIWRKEGAMEGAAIRKSMT